MIHIGKETQITIAGKVYTLSRYTRRLLCDLLEWAQERLGNPLADLRYQLEEFPTAIQAELVQEATKCARLRSSPYYGPVQALWESAEGRVFELGLLLKKHHPELTPDQVAELYLEACLEHGDDYLPYARVVCMGQMPLDESASDREILQRWGYLPGGDDRPERDVGIDWLEIDKALLKHFNLKPWELEELTMTEIYVLFQSLAEKEEAIGALDQAQAYNKLSPAEKLELALMQYG